MRFIAILSTGLILLFLGLVLSGTVTVSTDKTEAPEETTISSHEFKDSKAQTKSDNQSVQIDSARNQIAQDLQESLADEKSQSLPSSYETMAKAIRNQQRKQIVERVTLLEEKVQFTEEEARRLATDMESKMDKDRNLLNEMMFLFNSDPEKAKLLTKLDSELTPEELEIKNATMGESQRLLNSIREGQGEFEERLISTLSKDQLEEFKLQETNQIRSAQKKFMDAVVERVSKVEGLEDYQLVNVEQIVAKYENMELSGWPVGMSVNGSGQVLSNTDPLVMKFYTDFQMDVGNALTPSQFEEYFQIASTPTEIPKVPEQ